MFEWKRVDHFTSSVITDDGKRKRKQSITMALVLTASSIKVQDIHDTHF